MRRFRTLLAMVLLLVAPHSVDALPPNDGCAYTPAYWAEHPDLWPVDQLEVGHVTRDKAELQSLLDAKGNAAELGALMRETIAAKLNVANGASSEISPYITWADAILALGKDNSRRFRHLRGMAAINEVRRTLAEYNEQGCSAAAAGFGVPMKTSEGNASFGDLKALYR